jgi:hypothetical protein
MSIRFCLLCLLVLSTTLVWTKETLDPAALLAQCDAQYYTPTAHGVTDLAVDIVIENLSKHPIVSTVRISYYATDVDHQRFVVTGLDAAQAEWRDRLLAMVSPLSEYIMPRSTQATFAGLQLSAKSVFRQISGVDATTFHQVTGKDPEGTEVQEYRVLLDRRGVIHAVENVMVSGGVLSARVENTPVGGQWLVSRVITRLPANDKAIWKIDSVQYEKVQEVTLPSHVTTEYRNNYGQPENRLQDLTFRLTNYRINTGEASRLLAPAPTTPPAP